MPDQPPSWKTYLAPAAMFVGGSVAAGMGADAGGIG